MSDSESEELHSSQSLSIYQGFFNNIMQLIDVAIVHETKVDVGLLDAFFDKSNSSSPIGISATYGSTKGRLRSLAFSMRKDRVLVIELSDGGDSTFNAETRYMIQNRLLARDVGDLYAFDLAPLALSLHIDLGMNILNGVDLQSVVKTDKGSPSREIIDAIRFVVGKDSDIGQPEGYHVKQAFSDLSHSKTARQLELRAWVTQLSLRAWLTQFLANVPGMDSNFDQVPKINTAKLTAQYLDILSNIARDAQRLDSKKPDEIVHEAKASWTGEGEMRVDSTRYQTRMRGSRNGNQTVRVEVAPTAGIGSFVLPANTTTAGGRTASVALEGGVSLERRLLSNNVKITTVGRGDPTTAEKTRAADLLRILQGGTGPLEKNPWFQNIFKHNLDSDVDLTWPPEFSEKSSKKTKTGDFESQQRLNNSQRKAVDAMLSTADKNRISIILGPPGTGKTSTISAFVESAVGSGQKGIWLVAQSNVAVKNICEKLTDIGFHRWRVIVSKDFHFDWHEHLYQRSIPKTNFIRSDDLKPGFKATQIFQDCDVVLCTLSMLSSDRLRKFGVTRMVPLRTLVVDEASQIELGDYFPIFNQYQGTLRKMCFIGDDKQLPPFGAEDLICKSIFEVQHLRKLLIMLDTQYRMPPQLGDFISEEVYGGELLSNPLHPITGSTVACHFVNVTKGFERKDANSWMNVGERNAVLQLATVFQEQNKKFRIITPYDAQRSALELDLQKEGLNWEDKCFNVDSFQGNEEDWIIISLVRSRDLGFLNNLRRTNVMMTRCKRGMIIFTSKNFLNGKGSSTLAGKLARRYGENAWIEVADLETTAEKW